MKDVSFTSAIRPVTCNEFTKAVSSIARKNCVNYPWTINESVKAPQAYTKGVCDCSLLGITDGNDVLMMHLCPTNSNNKNYFQIKRFISSNVDLKNPNLQAILIGSKEIKTSEDLYNKLAEFMQEWKIPFSQLKTSANGCKIDVAYSSPKDEWIVTCNKIDKLIRSGVNDSLKILKDVFKNVNISQADEVY